MFDFTAVAKDLGPYAALLLFFLYRDYRRDEKREIELAEKTATILSLTSKFIELSTRYEQQSEKVASCVNMNTEVIRSLISKCATCASDAIEPPQNALQKKHPSGEMLPQPMESDTTKIRTTPINKDHKNGI